MRRGETSARSVGRLRPSTARRPASDHSTRARTPPVWGSSPAHRNSAGQAEASRSSWLKSKNGRSSRPAVAAASLAARKVWRVAAVCASTVTSTVRGLPAWEARIRCRPGGMYCTLSGSGVVSARALEKAAWSGGGVMPGRTCQPYGAAADGGGQTAEGGRQTKAGGPEFRRGCDGQRRAERFSLSGMHDSLV